MNKNIAIFSIVLIFLVGVALVFYNSNVTENYVVFANHESMDDELRAALVKRLESNKIPYQIDMNGNVKIPEKDASKAVECCS